MTISPISLLAFTCCILATGCSREAHRRPDDAEFRGSVKPVTKARVSSRPGNVNGGVFIVEYHKIAKEEARWDRSIEKFKSDLERLYKMGFRPVTLTSYLDNKMDLAPGASPIIFTFDDSQISQFRMLPSGSIDPDCAVGIWGHFAERHPDFPVRATFFVLPPVPWGQADDLPKKLAYIRQWGCELGSHTLSHRRLDRLSDEQVKQELGGAIDRIRADNFEPSAIALPYGISPKNATLLKTFILNGQTYTHRAALLVGAGPAPAPASPTVNYYRLPRIQGIDEPYGITYWLDKVAAGKCAPYVQP